LTERNNHGHAVLLWLRDHSRLWRLLGHDRAEGWLSNSKGKALLYDATADAFRERETTLHSFHTCHQLASIDGATLRAPQGESDDLADSYALACQARRAQSCASFKGLLVYNDVPFEMDGDPNESVLEWLARRSRGAASPPSNVYEALLDLNIDLNGE